MLSSKSSPVDAKLFSLSSLCESLRLQCIIDFLLSKIVIASTQKLSKKSTQKRRLVIHRSKRVYKKPELSVFSNTRNLF